MRFIRFFALIVCALLLCTSSLVGQGKDKDKDKDKEPKKDPSGKFPTEIAGKDLDQWIKEIKDFDPSHRQTAIRTVVNFGPPAKKAVLSLVGRMYVTNEGDAGVRADAATALGVIGLDPKNKDELSKGLGGLGALLADQQRPVRIAAINAVARLGPDAKSLIPTLNGTLGDTVSWEVRRASATALGIVARDAEKGPDAAALKALVSALTDNCAAVRMEAVSALSMLGPSPREADMKMEKVALEDRLVKERDARVKLWVRVLLMFLDEKTYLTPKGLETIAKGLADSDINVRCQAAQALGTLGPKAKAQVDDVIEAAKDKNLELSLIAINSLARLGAPKGMPVLEKMIGDAKEDLAVRCAACRAAGTLSSQLPSTGPGVAKQLVGLFDDKEPELVIAALQGISQLGNDATPHMAAIKKLTESKDEGIKHTAEEVVKFLTDKPSKK
ncbi:MAG: HEAT repeat domain-containing protein [Gemmataceae bacterium]|nr:HEAT repeat domain-containing protein [Gemmataceae bacterium]